MGRSCSEGQPCRYFAQCLKCTANQWLTAEDWHLLEFYRRVSGQQTEMGTPRLEGYEATLRLYRYPESEWTWLVEGASFLNRILSSKKVDWVGEFGKPYPQLSLEDCR